MFRRLRSLVADYREFLAEWRKLPTKPKAKGWGALGGLSNEQIDEALVDEDLHFIEPEQAA